MKVLTLNRRAASSLGVVLLVGASSCASVTPAGEPVPQAESPSPAVSPIEFQVRDTDLSGLGDAIVQSMCESRPVHFKGQGFSSKTRLALWLQGDQRVDFFRPPGDTERAVRIFEVPVQGDGTFEATYTFSRLLGPLEDGRAMTLAPGRELGQVLLSAEGSEPLRLSVYRTIALPSLGCSAFVPLPSPSWRLEPASACINRDSELRVVGSGLLGDRAHLIVVSFGSLLTRRPRTFKDLGFAAISPDGTLDHRISLNDFPAGDYLLTVFDDHDTRRSNATTRDLNFTVCGETPRGN